MLGKLLEMGVLRNLLHGSAVIFAILMPFAHGPEYSNSWNLFFNGILPATAPLIVIVIGLDIMMTSIWKSDADEARLIYLNRVINTHLIVGGLLLLSWLTVFLPVLV
jgi:hypothetical protein